MTYKRDGEINKHIYMVITQISRRVIGWSEIELVTYFMVHTRNQMQIVNQIHTDKELLLHFNFMNYERSEYIHLIMSISVR